jgi:hypothetical protein
MKLLYPGKVTLATWDKITDLVIARYFKHPSYWKIDGKPYFSIYEMNLFLESFGSVEGARAALDRFREKARAAGFPGLHINAVLWGEPRAPGSGTPIDWAKLSSDLALDSLTGYTWVHYGALNYSTFPTSDYVQGRDGYLKFYDAAITRYPVPYFPNVTINWDNSPRAHPDAKWDKPAPYVVNPVMVGNSPAAFREACELIKKRLLAAPTTPKIVTINAWNEWPEGSVLEPEKEYGYGYRRRFGRCLVTNKLSLSKPSPSNGREKLFQHRAENYIVGARAGETPALPGARALPPQCNSWITFAIFFKSSTKRAISA